jgi:predicted PurR-regulated permease PerM
MLSRLLFRSKAKPEEETTAQIRFPFYVKAPLVLIGLFLLFHILFLLQDVLIPISFALLIAILLNPLVNRLNRMGASRVLSIGISLLLAIVIFGSLIAFLSLQVSSFSEMAPELEEKGTKIWYEARNWIRSTFGLSLVEQKKIMDQGLDQGKSLLGNTLMSILSFIGTLVLLPIYIFLILYYKPMFINFFYEVFGYKHSDRVSEVLTETKSAVQSYIQGLMIETGIVGVLNSAALLVIGVEYAVLLGVIGALLNLIPYIGGLIAIALPVLMSLVSGDGMSYTTPLYIVGAYALIQFVDNNIIVPRIVSSKVEVNALVSLVVVLLGGALWGAAGMFLSIPFVAILKIIFDRIDELQPWGMLLGTKMNPDFSLEDIGTAQAEQKSALNDSAEDPEISFSDLNK